MSTTRRDVQLIVTAKDQASRAIQSAEQALAGLFEAAKTGAPAAGAGVASLVGHVVALEKAMPQVDAAVAKGSAAWERMQQRLAATRAELAAVEQQIVSGGRALSSLRAGGGDTGQIKAVETALASLEKQQRQLATSAATQERALGQSRSSLQQLGSTANAVEAALASVGTTTEREMLRAAAATERQTQEWREQAAAARQAGEAAQVAARNNAFMGVTVDPKGAVAGKSAAVFDEQIRAAEGFAAAAREVGAAEEQMAAKAAALRARLDPMAVIQNRLNRELKEARDLYRAGKISATELAAAEKLLAQNAAQAADALNRQGRGERGRPSLFGLKPYELTNLGYQVNDVFTQLASGTSLTQTLAQQGGQLLQLFPKLGSTIVAALGNPLIVASVATFGGLALVMKRVGDEAERLRGMEGFVASLGEGASLNAIALADAAKSLDYYSMSAEDAVAITRTFVREGMDLARIEEFGRTAQDMADILGIKVTEAAEKMSRGFSGGYDAMVELANATDVLSASDRELMREMAFGGRMLEARALLFDRLQGNMDDAARKANGPWKSAFRALDRTWGDLLDTIGDTAPVKAAAGALEELAKLASWALGGDGGMDQVQDLANRIVATAQILEAMKKARAAAEEGGDAASIASFDRLIAKREAQLAALRKEGEQLRKQIELGPIANQNSPEARDYAARVTEELKLQREELYAITDAEKIRIEGAKAYREEIKRSGNEVAAQERRQFAEEERREQIRRQRAKEAEQRARQQRREWVEDINDNGREGLVGTARRYTGAKESDPLDNAMLRNLFKAAGPQFDVDPAKVAWCAAFINAVLSANGLPTTGSNMARSFLGYGSNVNDPKEGDIVVLKRGNNSAQGHVGLFMGFDPSGGVRVLGGNQSDGVNTKTFKRDDVLGFRRAPSAGEVATDQARDEERRLKQQEDFNQKLDEENARRRVNIEHLKATRGLANEALFDEQRRFTVAEAIRLAEQEAARNNLVLDKARREEIEKTVGAEWDLLNARERAEKILQGAQGERDALLSRLDQARELGDTATVAALEDQLGRVDAALRKAIQGAIDFWKSMGDTPEARAAILGLETLRSGLADDAAMRGLRAIEEPMEQLQSMRSELMEQIQFFRDQGQMGVAEQLKEQLRDVDQALLVAIDRLIEFWSVSTRPEAAATLMGLQNLRNQIVAAGNEFAVTAGQIQQMFAGSLTSSVTQWAEAIGQGRNAISSTWEMFVGFAADFTRQIANMLLQALALKAAMKIGFEKVAGGLNSFLNVAVVTAGSRMLEKAGDKVTIGGAAVGIGALALKGAAGDLMKAALALAAANAAGSAGIFHAGGIAGSANRARPVQPAWFANAMRYHGGGIAGLRPNEVPAILERGEEILDRSNPRHIANTGGAGGGGTEPNVHLKNVVVFDPAEVIANGLNTAVGERTFLTFVTRNAGSIQAALDSGR